MQNDPVIEDLLTPFEAEHRRTASERARQREIEEKEKRQRLVLYELLTAIKTCGPGVVIDRRTGECISAERFQDVMAERLLMLVKFLKEKNQLGRLDRLPADSPASRFLRHILVDSTYGANEIAELLRRVEPLDDLAADLCFWLRGRLQEILYPDQWPETDSVGPVETPREECREYGTTEQAAGSTAEAGREGQKATRGSADAEEHSDHSERVKNPKTSRKG